MTLPGLAGLLSPFFSTSWAGFQRQRQWYDQERQVSQKYTTLLRFPYP